MTASTKQQHIYSGHEEIKKSQASMIWSSWNVPVEGYRQLDVGLIQLVHSFELSFLPIDTKELKEKQVTKQ